MSSSSKGGGGGDGQKKQKQGGRDINTKDKPRVQKKDKATEIPGGELGEALEEKPEETLEGAPDGTQDIAKDPSSGGKGKGPAAPSANDSKDSGNCSVKSSEVSHEGDNWEPVSTGKVLKKGRRKQEGHDLPPLQIAGVVDPYKDKIARDKAAALSQEDFNTDVAERIQRGRGGEVPLGMTRGIPRNELVARFENESTDHFDAGWRKRPEVPTTEELLRDVVNLPTNLIDGPYDSVDDYLETHYELLREDAFAGLRDAVLHMKDKPNSLDTHDVSIYEDVRILGLTFSKMGVACKVSFSTNRAQKKIPWMHSKRLIPGTLVCISADEFQTVKVATVAARPMCGLENNPPEVDLLFNEDELEIDTERVFVMIESRNGYYEAYKWTLRTLQRMTKDNFPLHEHICFLEKNVPPPEYVKRRPFLNLSPIFPDIPDKEALEDVNIINAWPQGVRTTMDHTQMTALKSILTRRVSVIQGPPGTGKTFVSVRALEILLHNMDTGDPPIIVACQTNHALDQLLNHVLKFEDEVVRLGGRTQDKDKIKDHTIFELRRKSTSINIQGSQRSYASANMKKIQDKMMKLFESLKQEVLTPEDFYENGLINAAQAKSFTERSAGWVIAEESNIPGGITGQWLGEFFREIQIQEPRDGEYEEGDIEEEKLKEIEQDFLLSGPGALGEQIDDRLKGHWFFMGRAYTVDKPVGVTQAEIQQALRVGNVWDLEGYMRAAVYHHLRQRLRDKIWNEAKRLNKDYQKYCRILKISKLEKDAHIISSAKLIGMTTTGLGKYRSIIAAVRPKVVLIEEAAEALEGPVVIACMPSVEHLILVGDHKQLRGHCSDSNLSDGPYNLDISMFERLVTNELPYETLKTQRRMRPEIREILKPIYEDTLVDHQSVLGRDSIPGMGDTNVYWYTHFFPEATDAVHSRVNINEANMIINFADYLALNGVKPADITILTFYAGQRSEIIKGIRKNPNLSSSELKVKTVDSYQGEENEVILLSLVRSNPENHIGFLSIANRVCVALSRARRGLYIFGNATIITKADKLWWEVGNILNEPPSRIGVSLPLTCHKHKSRMTIEDPLDWIDINGGCRKWCKEVLPCNHNCILRCHPFGHGEIRCTLPCTKILSCNHPCNNECWKECICQKCGKKSENAPPQNLVRSNNQTHNTSPPPHPPSPAAAVAAVAAVAAIENRQSENPFPRPGNVSRPQTATQKLVDIDNDWESALPGGQPQSAVRDRAGFPEMARGQAVPFNDYNHAHPQSDYPPQNYHQGNRPQNNHSQNQDSPQNSYSQDSYSRSGYPQSSYHQDSRPQNSHPQDSYPYRQDSYHQNNHPQDAHQENHPKNSHPQGYPPNNYPQNNPPQNHRQNNYGEADHYSGNSNSNSNPNRPNMPVHGGAYGTSRRQVKEQWPAENENGQVIDDGGGMGRGEYDSWDNRRGYPPQARRPRDEWPALGRGSSNTPASPRATQRGTNNAWGRGNTQNRGSSRGGEPPSGARGQDNPWGVRGKRPMSYAHYR